VYRAVYRAITGAAQKLQASFIVRLLFQNDEWTARSTTVRQPISASYSCSLDIHFYERWIDAPERRRNRPGIWCRPTIFVRPFRGLDRRRVAEMILQGNPYPIIRLGDDRIG
jgi:hypothetical protein